MCTDGHGRLDVTKGSLDLLNITEINTLFNYLIYFKQALHKGI